MQYQGLREQKIVNDSLPGLARELDLPMVITNDVHYLRNGDHKPHDILLCIGTGKSVNDTHRLKYGSDEFYLKTPEQMWERFGEYPDALTNTARIAERCNVNLDDEGLPPAQLRRAGGRDPRRSLRARSRARASPARLPRLQDLISRGALRHTLDEYATRLDYEIAMIQKMGYTGYFLIVWDFIRYAREQGIPVGPGRGSAAGSVVAWCLRITDVDPIEFDLIFERFLNPERVSMPDIDIDFCERRRGEVIEYVTRKYGRENVAQIITFGTMKAKAVVRDVGRVLDMTYADVDRVAKLIPPALDMTLEKALLENPALKQLRDSDPKVKELLEIGQRLEGMTRHASVHAAGVVIAPSAITDYAPLYKGARDEIVTQWAMKEIERMGLLKMDFLGLSTLTLIDDALKEIKRTTGETLDIDAIPMDDAKTFALFADGQTAGVFQFESLGHARGAAQGQAVALRRPDRAQRAVPARPARRRRRRQLRESPARARSRSPTWCRRWSRSSATPTGSSPTRNRSCAWRATSAASRWAKPTCCARPWARRTPRSWRRSAIASCRARSRTSSRRRRPARSSTCWPTSPATASTSRTRPPTRCSRTRPAT